LEVARQIGEKTAGLKKRRKKEKKKWKNEGGGTILAESGGRGREILWNILSRVEKFNKRR